MPFELSISISDQASPALAKLLQALSTEGLTEINEVAAREGVNFLKEYHREMATGGGWSNPSLPTHGSGREKSRFGEDVARAWQVADVRADGFTLSNNATGFAHKVTGGTITAKNAKALTIPMVPAAHGVRARDYPGTLFKPKGLEYLMEVDSQGVGRVVYLLRKSVTHKPWEGALPPEGELEGRVLESITEMLAEEIG